jgi:hypothetical protein
VKDLTLPVAGILAFGERYLEARPGLPRPVREGWAKSEMKKFKDRAFAAGVDREEVSQAVEELGVDLKEHIQFVIEAMREIALELGLEGEKI